MNNEGCIISNYSGYGYPSSENYEHDDTGSIHNYSACEDWVFEAMSEHGGWVEGDDCQFLNEV